MATPMQAGRVAVQVVCVARGAGFVKDMLVPVGQTIGWSVNASGLYGLKPDLRDAKIGVWGKLMAAETVVHSGDRIEIYSPVCKEAAGKARSLRARTVAHNADLEDNGANEEF